MLLVVDFESLHIEKYLNFVLTFDCLVFWESNSGLRIEFWVENIFPWNFDVVVPLSIMSRIPEDNDEE